jgi:DNA-binding HxlR family transcriptional regulator
MKRTTLSEHPCSIARTLDSVGEWWTPLIVRDIAYGVRRFREIQEDLGISANVLTDRLDTLVDRGIVQTRVYQDRPQRSEYVLTPKGEDLVVPLIALMQWGDRHEWGEEGGPVRVVHEACGEQARVELRCTCCGRELRPDELRAVPGRAVTRPPRAGEPGHVSGRRLGAGGGVALAR